MCVWFFFFPCSDGNFSACHLWYLWMNSELLWNEPNIFPLQSIFHAAPVCWSSEALLSYGPRETGQVELFTSECCVFWLSDHCMSDENCFFHHRIYNIMILNTECDFLNRTDPRQSLFFRLLTLQHIFCALLSVNTVIVSQFNPQKMHTACIYLYVTSIGPCDFSYGSLFFVPNTLVITFGGFRVNIPFEMGIKKKTRNNAPKLQQTS